MRLTHIGGPTALIELDGWRLLTDPTFDPPGRTYAFGWGTRSRKLAGPASRPGVGPIDAVLLSHDHHADNLDDAGRALLPAPGDGGDDGPGRDAARWRRARPRALGDDDARGARPAGDRGHRDPVPTRPAAEPADRGRRRRLRAALGRPGARRPLDVGRHRPLRRGPPRSPSGCRSARAAPRRRRAVPVTGPLRYSLTGERRPSRPASCGPRTRCRCTTRAGATSGRAATRSSAGSPPRPARAGEPALAPDGRAGRRLTGKWWTDVRRESAMGGP